MKTLATFLLAMTVISACAGAPALTEAPPPSAPTAVPEPVNGSTPAPLAPAQEPSALPPQPAADDPFTQMGISLPQPACNGLTQPQMEGPYYTPDTPERNSLLEEGMPGTRLILVGYVLDQDCQPMPNAWLDFWQADAGGEYDNVGYRLRGHQFTDAQGRYYLETVLPGLYNSRPIEHIHVKVRPEGGAEVTSQLYFPNQPVDGLTVTLEERGDFFVGYFDFVVQK